MKILLASLAMFLYADNSIQITKGPVSPAQENAQLTFDDLVSFTKKSPQKIEKILLAKNWVSTTEEDILSEMINKGDYSWKLRKNKEQVMPAGSIYYYHGENENSQVSLVYKTYEESRYDEMKLQSYDLKGLLFCKENEHEEEYGDDDYWDDTIVDHGYTNDFNIIFKKGEFMGLFASMILFEVKKK